MKENIKNAVFATIGVALYIIVSSLEYYWI